MQKIKLSPQELSKALLVFFALIALTNARADLIKGKVLGPDGKPAPQAQVWVQPFDVFNVNQAEYSQVKLDAAGAFQIELSATAFSPNLFGRISLYQPGFAPAGGMLGKTANTFRLESALPVSGKVTDEKGAPVAGANVVLNLTFPSEGARYVGVKDTPLEKYFSTTTDAGGAWKVLAGSKNTTVVFEVLAPDFAKGSSRFAVGEDSVTKLRPGASLSGRVVYEGGAPAAGVYIGALAQAPPGSRMAYGEVKSKADGSFQIDNLDVGTYIVSAIDSSRNWVADPAKNIITQARKTVAVPDITFVKGALIEGTFSDENGAPIAGAYLSAYDLGAVSDGSSFQTVSDEKGFYRLRVLPGKIQLTLNGQPEEFLNPEENVRTQLFEIAGGQTKTISFVLKRGLAVTGSVRDEKGVPVAGVYLGLKRAIKENGYTSYESKGARSDENGVWKIAGLTRGKWQMHASGDWQLSLPIEVTIPNQMPLAVRVASREYFTLRGRVKSFDDKPIAGVSIVFSVTTPMSEGGMLSQRNVVSDETGWYEIPKLKGVETVRFVWASKPGFHYSKGGELLDNPGKSAYSDIVMSAQNAKLAGVVIDADKKPVAGARVLSPDAADPQAVVLSDSKGHFLLENLPQGFVRILAIAPEKGAVISRQISDGSDVELQLVPTVPTPPQDLERALKILEEASQNDNGKSWGQATAVHFLLPIDFERAAQFGTDADGKLSESFITQAIDYLVKHDPDKAVTWGLAHLDEIKSGWSRSQAITTLALAVADKSPQLAEDLYNRLRVTAPGENWAALMHQYYLALLATKLHHADAPALVDQILQVGQASQLNKQGQGNFGGMLAEGLVKVDVKEAVRMYESLQGDEKSMGLQSVVGALAARGDKESFATALKLLNEMQNSNTPNSEGQFGYAAVHLVSALGKTDPAAATALARRVTDSFAKAQALTRAA